MSLSRTEIGDLSIIGGRILGRLSVDHRGQTISNLVGRESMFIVHSMLELNPDAFIWDEHRGFTVAHANVLVANPQVETKLTYYCPTISVDTNRRVGGSADYMTLALMEPTFINTWGFSYLRFIADDYGMPRIVKTEVNDRELSDDQEFLIPLLEYLSTLNYELLKLQS